MAKLYAVVVLTILLSILSAQSPGEPGFCSSMGDVTFSYYELEPLIVGGMKAMDDTTTCTFAMKKKSKNSELSGESKPSQANVSQNNNNQTASGNSKSHPKSGQSGNHKPPSGQTTNSQPPSGPNGNSQLSNDPGGNSQSSQTNNNESPSATNGNTGEAAVGPQPPMGPISGDLYKVLSNAVLSCCGSSVNMTEHRR